jgi:hypothetical protein
MESLGIEPVDIGLPRTGAYVASEALVARIFKKRKPPITY